jgi:UDP-GlcNAc:undecaprenyl-phosphate GlcNAc-1-phosphate transferase
MVGVVVGFAIALAWSYLATWLGPRLGVIDTPGGDALKVHSRPTPLLGGVGVFAGLHIGLLVEGAEDVALLAGSSLALVLGLVDDRSGLSPRIRLIAEAVAAAVLVALLGDGLRNPAGFAFGVILVLVAINAVNLLDGIDALVGSTAFISALGIAWVGAAGYGEWRLGAVLAAALAGFLILNRPRARIFLGDNGAYTIGVFLAYGALRTTQKGVWSMLLIAVGLLGVFVIDLTVTIVRRARNGKELFGGDRSHIYDQLRDRGWSTGRVVIAASALQTALVAALVGYALSDPGAIDGIAVVIGMGCVALVGAWKLGFIDVVD